MKFENILTSRIRTLNEFQLTFTSGREPRYSYRGSVNVALGERWVWRTTGGYTHENPTLRAWNAGSTFEFELAPRWLVSVSGTAQAFVTPEENSDGEDSGGRQRQVTVARPLGADDLSLGRDGERTNVLGGIRWLYRSRGWRGRVLLIFTGFAVALVLVVMGILLMRI